MSTHLSTLFYDSPPAPRSLIDAGTEELFAPQDMLAEANAPLEGCFYIVEGLVFATSVAESGQKTFGLIVSRNTLVGESFLLLNMAAPMGFQAQIETRALFIPRERFLELFRTDIRVAQYTAVVSALKTQSIRGLYSNWGRKSVTWRICNVILELSYRYGRDFEGGRIILFPLSHQLLADFANANRVTVTRCMQSLMRLGLVRRINNAYCIPDLEKLQHYAKSLADDPKGGA